MTGALQRLLRLDARASQRLRAAEKVGWLRPICVALAHSGDSWFWLAGLAVMALALSGAWRERAIIFILGILVTAVLTMAVKFTIRRQRPPGEWGEVYRSVDPHSFPSGHAARAAMLVVVSAFTCPLWLTLALLVWAPLVGLARVAMGVHYLSDVVAGGLLGLLTGVGVCSFLFGLF